MKLLSKVGSGIGLFLTIAPSVLVFNNAMELDTAKLVMLLGTVIWFAGAPLWMNEEASLEQK